MGSPFTSARNGLWDARDADTWGQGLGAYPHTAADVVNVGHTVTYNVVSTTEMGLITITNGGILTFLNSMSTKLTLGHVEIAVSNGGELRVGAAGAIIPKQYLAEVIWNPTSDNAKGIAVAAGGKLTVYGDPDYFGSDYDTVLTASSGAIPAAGNAVTITVVGDFTTKWAAGQELVVHSGGAYAHQTNDFCRLAITGVAANGSNTDVACTVTERPAALTCAIGADVVNVSRNVLFYKLAYNTNLGAANTNRPRLTNANVTGTTNLNIHDAQFAGWYNGPTGIGVIFDGVMRNTLQPFAGAYQAIINGLSVSNGTAYYNIYNCSVGGKALCFPSSITGANNLFSGDFYGGGNGTSGISGFRNTFTGFFYSSYGNNYQAADCKMIGGGIGYDRNGVAKSQGAYAFSMVNYSNIAFVNVKMVIPPSFYVQGRNLSNTWGRLTFEHYGQVANAHYIADAFGNIYKVAADGSGDNPSQRAGGGADVQEAAPLSNCAAATYLELFNVRLWATAGVSKTYRFYLQTDFAALAKTALVLYGEYLDNNPAGTGHLATVNSSGAGNFTTRANAGDWSQYVEVTINPATTGFVNLYLRLMAYESGKKIWIDPQVDGATLGSTDFIATWSLGEVQLEQNMPSSSEIALAVKAAILSDEIAFAGADVAAIKNTIDTNLDETVSSRSTLSAGAAMTLTGDYDAAKTAATQTSINTLNDISVSDILAGLIEGSITLKQAIQAILAYGTGKANGGGSNTIHFRNQEDDKNRITMTVDANGNRTAVILDVD